MTDSKDAFEKALYPALERLIEMDHPNPHRSGCPDHSLLERAATSPDDLSEEESATFVAHILRCWPCFKEVKSLRQERSARKRL
jgi:hypothetical protein